MILRWNMFQFGLVSAVACRYTCDPIPKCQTPDTVVRQSFLEVVAVYTLVRKITQSCTSDTKLRK